MTGSKITAVEKALQGVCNPLLTAWETLAATMNTLPCFPDADDAEDYGLGQLAPASLYVNDAQIEAVRGVAAAIRGKDQATIHAAFNALAKAFPRENWVKEAYAQWPGSKDRPLAALDRMSGAGLSKELREYEWGM